MRYLIKMNCCRRRRRHFWIAHQFNNMVNNTCTKSIQLVYFHHITITAKWMMCLKPFWNSLKLLSETQFDVVSGKYLIWSFFFFRIIDHFIECYVPHRKQNQKKCVDTLTLTQLELFIEESLEIVFSLQSLFTNKSPLNW